MDPNKALPQTRGGGGAGLQKQQGHHIINIKHKAVHPTVVLEKPVMLIILINVQKLCNDSNNIGGTHTHIVSNRKKSENYKMKFIYPQRYKHLRPFGFQKHLCLFLSRMNVIPIGTLLLKVM